MESLQRGAEVMEFTYGKDDVEAEEMRELLLMLQKEETQD